ncbi:MAG: outer membrane protein assembly factor BamD [Proteobacteria bacterium]|nr:outer membrane protein assembly factor BamD [Pseudomonadota bacterium]
MKPFHLARLLRPTLFLFIGLLSIPGCSSEEKVIDDRPVEELYGEAQRLMKEEDYNAAAKQFEEVERQHPYSAWATRAQLMTGYAFYEAMDYDSAIVALDQFVQIHPGHKDVAYAYYLAALSEYERLADVRRDQSNAKNALTRLQAVVNRFPDTAYAKDAQLKIALVNDHLAGAEMEVGRNYLKQKLYTAAVGRFRTVVEKYQTTSHVPEALHRLVECYLALGITEEAKAVAAVLGHNFPGSSWYENSYKLLVKENLAPERSDKSWVSGLWDTL